MTRKEQAMTNPISILSGRLHSEPDPVTTVAPAPAAMAYDAGPTWEDSALAEVNQILKKTRIGVQFEFDRKTDTLIAWVVDVETGALLYQMPADEVMALSKALGKLHDVLKHQAICRKAQELDQSHTPAPLRWRSPWMAATTSGHEAGALWLV